MYSEQDPSLFPGGVNASIPPHDASDEVPLPVSANEVSFLLQAGWFAHGHLPSVELCRPHAACSLVRAGVRTEEQAWRFLHDAVVMSLPLSHVAALVGHGYTRALVPSSEERMVCAKLY